MSYRVELFDSHFNPFEVIQEHQSITPDTGAQSIFIGYMRDFREDTHVEKMHIAHYPPMTQKQLETLAQQLLDKYRLLDLYVAHRVGDVLPTDPLVAISSTASHRTNAITATTEMLEMLKHHAPFWKKEYKNSLGNWVESNTSNQLK